MNDKNNGRYQTLTDQLRYLFNLEVDNVRLLLTEKLTILLSAITFYAILILLGICIAFFLTISAVSIMLNYITPHLAYLIVAAIYFILMTLFIILRYHLIINPIAKFLSRILLDPPSQTIKADTEL